MINNKQIKIKDKESLIKIFKTISWLDNIRWKIADNYNSINFSKDDLTNCEKILTHWICYITDRQMPFEIVWDKGGYVFSEIVHEYSISNLPPQQILDKYYEKYIDKNSKERFRFKSTDNIVFVSRYITDDYQSILQTLEILDNEKYKRNIVAYVIDIIKRFQNEEDLLKKVACALHLLTYQLNRKKADSMAIIKILNNEVEFNKKFKIFKQTSTIGKKRLWCCIRDYKKSLLHKTFNEAMNEIADNGEELSNIWNNLPMNQIELPGDVWNNNPLFKNNLFANIIDLNSVPKNWQMPEIVRNLYNQLKNDEGIENFYPEQFDITFDFVPRMCDKKLCNICLFGKDGANLICITTQDKYCPVALLSCGYISKCAENQKDCIIKKGIGKGICRSGLKQAY